MALDDGLSSGVVDSEALGDLSDRRYSYIDDGPSLLNELQEFGPDFLTYLFVFFGRQYGLDVDRYHRAENELYLWSWVLRVYSLDLSTHLLIILYNIIRIYQGPAMRFSPHELSYIYILFVR